MGTGACAWSALAKGGAPGSVGMGGWSAGDGPRGAPLPADPLGCKLVVPCWLNWVWYWLREVGSIPERPAAKGGLLAWWDGPAMGACMG